jgi:hypothetical protein
MNMMRIAYFMFRMRKRAVTTPIFARNRMSVGIWKMAPKTSISFTYRPKAGSMRGMNVIVSDEKL